MTEATTAAAEGAAGDTSGGGDTDVARRSAAGFGTGCAGAVG